MDIEKIEALVKLVEESSLTEFSVKEGDLKISMSKVKYVQGESAGIAVSHTAAQTSAGAEQAEEEEQSFISSPIVGTFYAAPAPDAAAFVKIGDVIKAGQTVCILEAMKLMNEIESDFDCEIESVLVSNEQKVEYGQPLFRIRKL